MKKLKSPESSPKLNLRDFCVTHCIQVYLKLQEEMRKNAEPVQALINKPFPETLITNIVTQAREIVQRGREYFIPLSVLTEEAGLHSEESKIPLNFWHDKLMQPILGSLLQLNALATSEKWSKASHFLETALGSLQFDQAKLEQELDAHLSSIPSTATDSLCLAISASIRLTFTHLAEGRKPHSKLSAKKAETERAKNKPFTDRKWDNVYPLYDEEKRAEQAQRIENPALKNLRSGIDHNQFGLDPTVRFHVEINTRCEQLIRAHRELLARMASGLAINAMQAMNGEPGIVCIQVKETGRSEDRVLLRVRDTGQGFPEQVMAALNTGRDYESTTGGSGKNCGMIRDEALELGGSFAVSNYPEKGGDVKIVLPLKVFQEKKKAAKPSARKKGAKKGK